MNKIKEYFDNPAISQSDLIALSKSPYIFKKKKDNIDDYTSDALVLGSAVDCLLTDTDNWDKRFHIITEEKPIGQMGEYVDCLFNNAVNYDISDAIIGFKGFDSQEFKNAEEAVYKLVGFKRDSLDKVRERFNKEAKDYFIDLKKSIGKEKISFEIYEQALKIKEDILEGEYSKKYFTCNEDEEIHFQTAIYFKYELVDCKALIDVIKINHKNKTVTPIDIKTTEFLPNFKGSFWKYRYDLQSAWYLLAIGFWKEKFAKEIYQILPFKLIVAEKCCGHKPWVFKVSYDTWNTGRDGGTINGRQYKGYNTLIEEYKVCKSKEQWDYPVELLTSEIQI